MQAVKMYTTAVCPYCIRAKQLLKAKGVAEIEEIRIDTDPEARTEWRKKLRPRGFSLVILDKDLKTTLRKPLPWDVREITHAIDKFPIRRQEIQQGASTGAGG